MTDTILDKIKAYKLEEVAADKAARPLAQVEEAARLAPLGLHADRRDVASGGAERGVGVEAWAIEAWLRRLALRAGGGEVGGVRGGRRVRRVREEIRDVALG